MKTLPQSRQTDIVVQDLGKELLVYDLKTHQAFQLNETSMVVFQACGQEESFENLKRKYKFTDDLIHLALDKLKEQDLLEGEYVSPFAGMNRREVIKKAGLASMIALPIVSVIVAPHSAHAASGAVRTFGQVCDNSAQCASSAPYCSFSALQGGTGQGSQVCCRSQEAIVGAGYSYVGTYFRGPNNNICGNCSSNYGQDFCCSNTTRYNNTCTDNGNGTVNCSYTCQ